MQATTAAGAGGGAMFRGVSEGRAAALQAEARTWSRTQIEEIAARQGIAYILALQHSIILEQDIAFRLYRNFVHGFIEAFTDEIELGNCPTS